MENYTILIGLINTLLSSLFSAVVSITIYKNGIKTERRFSIYQTHLSTIYKTLKQALSEENLKIITDLESSIPCKYVSKELRKNLNGLIETYNILLKKNLDFLKTDSQLLVKNFIGILIKNKLLSDEYVIDESDEKIRTLIDEFYVALKNHAYNYFEDEQNVLETIFEYLCEHSKRLFDISITGNISDFYENSYNDFNLSRKYRTIDEELTRKFYADDFNRFQLYKQDLIKEIEKYY